MLTALLIVAAWPSNLTVAAAGLSLEKSEIMNHCWRDPKTGIYALKSWECDGGHRGITITKDRRVVASTGYNLARFGKANAEGYENEVESRSFTAVTKHGVRFGDSRTAITRKLGKPFKSVTRGSKGEFRCDLYKKVRKFDKESGEVLRNTYVYKNGKLIEIILNLDAFPGCGDENTSDTGWPWTKF